MDLVLRADETVVPYICIVYVLLAWRSGTGVAFLVCRHARLGASLADEDQPDGLCRFFGQQHESGGEEPFQ